MYIIPLLTCMLNVTNKYTTSKTSKTDLELLYQIQLAAPPWTRSANLGTNRDHFIAPPWTRSANTNASTFIFFHCPAVLDQRGGGGNSLCENAV